MRWVPILIGVVVLGGRADLAHACSGCPESSYWPSSRVLPAGLSRWAMALSAPAPSSTPESGDTLVLESSDGHPIESIVRVDPTKPHELWLEFAEPLRPRTEYRIEDLPHLECETATTVTLRVGELIPPPNALGRLTADPPIQSSSGVESYRGDCSSRFPVVGSTVRLHLDPSAEPWRDVLWLETYVDGALAVAGRTSLIEAAKIGTGLDRHWSTDFIFTACGAPGGERFDPAPPLTRPRVRFVATLPGTELRLETDELELELDCNMDSASTNPAPSLDEMNVEGCGCLSSSAQPVIPEAECALMSALALLLCSTRARASRPALRKRRPLTGSSPSRAKTPDRGRTSE